MSHEQVHKMPSRVDEVKGFPHVNIYYLAHKPTKHQLVTNALHTFPLWIMLKYQLH